MNTFNAPLSPSLGIGAFSPAAESETPQTETQPETTPVSKPSIRDRILDAIKEAGGSIGSHDLSEALDDIPVANRRYHAQQMAKAGDIAVTGNTSNRIYSLPGVKPKAGVAKSSKPKAAKPAKQDQAAPTPPPQHRRWRCQACYRTFPAGRHRHCTPEATAGARAARAWRAVA